MRMMKSMAEKKLRKRGMKRTKDRVMRQCRSNGERKNLWRGDREPERVLKFDIAFLTTIYGEWFIQDAHDTVDSDVNKSSDLGRDEDDGNFEHLARPSTCDGTISRQNNCPVYHRPYPRTWEGCDHF